MTSVERSAVTDTWIVSGPRSLRLACHDTDANAPSLVVLGDLGTSVDAVRAALPGVDPVARLAAAGFNVAALDWPGHGRSGGQPGLLTYRVAIESVRAAVRAAHERWHTPLGLLGVGFGGALAPYAAFEVEQRVGLAALACLGALDLRDVRPLLALRTRRRLLQGAGWVAGRWGAEALSPIRVPTDTLMPPALLAGDPSLARALRGDPQAVRSYDLAGVASILLRPAAKPSLAAQRLPTLVAVGEEDAVLPVGAARRVVAQLGDRGQLWTLPGGSHQLLLEHQKAVVPVVAEFLHAHLAGGL